MLQQTPSPSPRDLFLSLSRSVFVMGSATETRPGLPSKPARRGGGDATAAAAATALGAVPPAEGARNGQGFRSFNAGGDSDGNNAGSSASSSTMRPISLDGSEEDAALQGAEYLSRSEVARRRLRRGRQLMKLYKRLYWGLIEEVRVRYRNYYWQYGRSPVEEEESGSEGEGEDNGGFASGTVDGEGMGESGRAGEVGSSRKRDRDRCAFPGCKTKPMALTMYCHPHILSDPRQKLYKPCSFPIKRYASLTLCMREIYIYRCKYMSMWILICSVIDLTYCDFLCLFASTPRNIASSSVDVF